MTSRRSWLLGLAVGALMTVNGVTIANAQSSGVPRSISYQGQLLDNGTAANGLHTFRVTYYDASGVALYTENFDKQPVTNGIFDLGLGSSSGGFPPTMSFNQQYFIGVSIDGAAELTPRTALGAAPYALNAAAVNGLTASSVPTPGALYPLDNTGHIDPAVLPPPIASITTINGVHADPSNDIALFAGQNIKLTPDVPNHRIIVDNTWQGVTGVIAGPGLVGGGNSGNVTISLGSDPINGVQLMDGSVAGSKISALAAGDGLYQDGQGNLNVGVDGSTIETNNDVLRIKAKGVTSNELAAGAVGTTQLADGSVTGAKVDPTTIQMRVTGSAAPGTFMQSIDQSGNVTTGTVQNDATLTSSITGSDVTLGINTANPNTWSAAQTFSAGANATDLSVNNNLTVDPGAGGVISFSGGVLQNVGDPVASTDAATKAYVDSQVGTVLPLAGDVVGPTGSNTINTTSTTTGDNVIAAANMGTTTVNAARVAQDLTINGGTVDNTPIGATTASTGAFTSVTASGLTMSGAADWGANQINNLADPTLAQDAATKNYVDNTIGAVPMSGDVTGTAGANTINTASATTGDNVIAAANMGTTTVNAARVAQDLTINGGTVDNTPIGATTASTGAFTSITGSSITLSGAADLGSNLINNVADPVGAQDAATKNYVDNSVGAIALGGDVTGAPGANSINTGSATTGDNVIAAANMGTTTVNAARIAQDLTINGGTVDNTPIGATTASTGAFTSVTASGLTMSGAADWGANQINNLADPTLAQDAATKNYVDNTIGAVPMSGDVTGTAGANTINTASATTGDNVIAAANMGTTTVNAARVAQDLTINGGTVDNTPIGATTASTGAFTSITGSSITLSGAADLGSNLINNVADPVGAQDAATKNYVDNSVGAIALGGDVTGAPGANSINTGSATTGDNVIAAANMGTTTVNAARIAQDLTINGGTVDNTPIGATTASTGAFTSITGSSITLSGAADLGSNLINNVADPVGAQDAATKNYVDNSVGAIALGGDVTGAPGANSINTGSATTGDNVIAAANMGTTTVNAARIAQDLTINGGTVDNTPIGATTASTGAFTSVTASGLTMSGAADWGANQINNLADPTLAQDAATKNYVDNTIGAVPMSGDVTGTAGANTINTASATTGDNVIAAANMGTTTVNAARVAQDLTINGGTVDNTPIGATTASTGAFTSITGSSITLSGAADLGSNLINNVADPVGAQDAATKNYVDNTVGAIALGGDVTGAPGANSINTGSATTGDNVIAAANMGTTTVNAARVAQDLTINGGTVDNTPIGATTASTGAFTSITGSSITLSGAADLGSNLINNVADPVGAQDAATKNYVDNSVGAIALGGDVTGAPGANSINTGSATTGDNVIAAANMGTTTVNAARIAQDLTINGGTVDNTPIGATTASTGAFTSVTASGLTMLGAADWGANQINNLADPTLAQDAATKAYVDNSFGAISLSGDVTGTTGATTINTGSATTGDNVIAAVNMGTTVIDDAHVDNVLTISGGSVDNSPIGAGTPSTGAFTTLAGTSLNLTGAANLGGNSILFVADPVGAQDAATKNYVDNTVGAIALGGDVTGAPGANSINTGSATTGDNVIAAANMGTTTVNAARVAQDLTINGGTVDNTPIGATTASTGAFTSITGSSITLSGAADLGSNLINNVADPVGAQDAATKNYVDNSVGAIALGGDVTGAPGANSINTGSATTGDNVIAAANMGTTTVNAARIAQDLTINGGTVDNTPIGATTASTGAFTSVTASGLTMSGAADWGANQINNLADPTLAQDAATKAYVDNSFGAISLSGDVTGTTGATTINTGSATTGDNVIAAVNMGTTVIDDAHVDNVLTISGGSVDNSPIGAGTPSTGAFTTLAGTSLNLTGAANLGGNSILFVADPVGAQDAATKNYVDNTVGAIALGGDVTGTAGANSINTGSATTGDNVIAAANMGTTTVNAARVAQDLTINGGTVDNSPIGATTPSTGAFTSIVGTGLTLTGVADLGSNQINNVANPTLAQDAATKNYVDNSISGISLAGDVAGGPSSNIISTVAGNHIADALNDVGTTTDISNTAINATFSTLNASTASNGISIGTGANQTLLSSSASSAQTVSFPNASGTMPIMLANATSLTAGTVTFSDPSITTSSHVFVTYLSNGGSQGILTATVGAGSVTVNSSNGADANSVDIVVFNQ